LCITGIIRGDYHATILGSNTLRPFFEDYGVSDETHATSQKRFQENLEAINLALTDEQLARLNV
jgi:hypothetical protein